MELVTRRCGQCHWRRCRSDAQDFISAGEDDSCCLGVRHGDQRSQDTCVKEEVMALHCGSVAVRGGMRLAGDGCALIEMKKCSL